MALNRVDYPTDLSTQSDFSDHGDLIETRYLDQSYHPLQVVSGNIPQGTVFQVGGVVYRADSDTAVSGTSSDYVRIVPNGATATAEYVADLTGVSWSAQYNGYYDGSGNLYIFDEGKALQNTAITAIMSRYLMQTTDGDVYVGRNVIAKKINTGHGDNELYPMDQGVRTTDSVEHAGMKNTNSFTPTATFFWNEELGENVRDAINAIVPNDGVRRACIGHRTDEDISTIHTFTSLSVDGSGDVTLYGTRTVFSNADPGFTDSNVEITYTPNSANDLTGSLSLCIL